MNKSTHCLLSRVKAGTKIKNSINPDGVHGYETIGVQGALRFLNNKVDIDTNSYSELFNIIVVPCVSPWAYATINR